VAEADKHGVATATPAKFTTFVIEQAVVPIFVKETDPVDAPFVIVRAPEPGVAPVQL
jgi:hypothetical protein